MTTPTLRVLVALAKADAPLTLHGLTGLGLSVDVIRPILTTLIREGFVNQSTHRETSRYQTTANGSTVVRLLLINPARYGDKAPNDLLMIANAHMSRKVTAARLDENTRRILLALIDERHGSTAAVITRQSRLPSAVVFQTLAAMIERKLIDHREPADGEVFYTLTTPGFMAAGDELTRQAHEGGIRP